MIILKFEQIKSEKTDYKNSRFDIFYFVVATSIAKSRRQMKKLLLMRSGSFVLFNMHLTSTVS